MVLTELVRSWTHCCKTGVQSHSFHEYIKVEFLQELSRSHSQKQNSTVNSPLDPIQTERKGKRKRKDQRTRRKHKRKGGNHQREFSTSRSLSVGVNWPLDGYLDGYSTRRLVVFIMWNIKGQSRHVRLVLPSCTDFVYLSVLIMYNLYAHVHAHNYIHICTDE